MMMRYFLHAFAVALVIPCQGFGIELAEAIRMGLQHSPTFQSSSSKLEEARATKSKYWGAVFPTIQAKGNYESRRDIATSRFTDPTNKESYLAALELSQPILTGGAMVAGIRLGRAEVQIAEQNLLVARQTLVSQIVQLYSEVAKLQEFQIAAESHRNLLKSYVDVTGRYAKIGRSREIDNLQSQVNFELVAMDVETIKRDLQTAVDQLTNLIGTKVDPSSVKALSTEPSNLKLPTAQQAIERAISQNPKIVSVSLTREKLKAMNAIDLSTDLPSLNLYAQAGYLNPNSEDLWMDRNRFEKIGLNLTIPIFSGLTSLSKRKIHSESNYQAERDLHKEKQDLTVLITTQLEQTQILLRQLRSTSEISSKSKRAFELANKGYVSGVVSNQDLVNFQRSRYDSEKLAIKTRFDFENSLVKLRELMGTDLVEVYTR